MSTNFDHFSEEELIRLIRTDGNWRYFSELVYRHEEYVIQKCRGFVKDQEAARDLSQEIFIKIFMSLGNYRSEAKFKTWLYSIIYHACIDHLRKNKRNVHHIITEKLADEISEVLDLDEPADDELTLQVLDELMEELLPEEKLILLLKYKEKHTIKAIELTLGLSESAVKMRLSRAREKINRLYKRYRAIKKGKNPIIPPPQSN
ncbi:MAG: RNA polymerase sigma factor [Cyclobacteriaceae bacterium]|nr:RNA polymerase sigma factor [Cyclobacteriaceae bacterium]